MDKFKNKYRIPTNRLKGYDYGAHGLYFVTICTKEKIHYFGTIVETHDYASQNNKSNSLNNCKSNTNNSEPNNHKQIELDNYKQIEPDNHKQIEPDNYLALRETEIGKIAREFWLQIPQHFPFVELDEFIVMPNHVHGILFFNKPNQSDWNPNTFGKQSQNLASVIRAYKASVKRFANQNNIEFEWQSRYHDRIIRDFNEFSNIQEYISNNPQKWANDDYNITN